MIQQFIEDVKAHINTFMHKDTKLSSDNALGRQDADDKTLLGPKGKDNKTLLSSKPIIEDKENVSSNIMQNKPLLDSKPIVEKQGYSHILTDPVMHDYNSIKTYGLVESVKHDWNEIKKHSLTDRMKHDWNELKAHEHAEADTLQKSWNEIQGQGLSKRVSHDWQELKEHEKAEVDSLKHDLNEITGQGVIERAKKDWKSLTSHTPVDTTVSPSTKVQNDWEEFKAHGQAEVDKLKSELSNITGQGVTERVKKDFNEVKTNVLIEKDLYARQLGGEGPAEHCFGYDD